MNKKQYDLSKLNELMSVVRFLDKKINKKFVFRNHRYFEHQGHVPIIFEIKHKSKVIHRVIWDNNAKEHKTLSNELETVVKDPDFSVLKKLLLYPNGIHMIETIKYETDQKSMFVNMREIFRFLTLKDNKDQAMALFNRTYHIGIKNSLITIFKLKVKDPYRRFYIHHYDEIYPQYSKSPFKVRNGDVIKIQDESALCFDLGDNKHIDMDIGITYSDSKFLYVGVKWKLKPVKKLNPLKRGNIHSFRDDGSTVFYERVKPSDKEIKGAERKIPYYSVNNQLFRVLIRKGKIFFVDLKINEKIEVTHGDLGVDLV